MLHAESPARPWFDGTRVLDSTTGTRVSMGPATVREAAIELLRTGAALAVDIETYGLAARDAERIKAVGVGTEEHVVIFDPRDEKQAHILAWLLAECPGIYAHNTAYDVPLLVRNELLTRAAIDKILDTLIWARMAWPSRTDPKVLGALAVKCLGAPKQAKDPLMTAFAAEGLTRSEGYRRYDIDRPVYVMGLVADVVTTARLAPIVRRAAWDRTTSGHGYSSYGVRGAEAERLLYREQRINRVFLRRSAKGLAVDLDFLDTFNDRYADELSSVAELLGHMGIKAGDSRTIVRWLDEQGLIDENWTRLKDGTPSGGKKLLERVGNNVVKLFLSHKEKDKVLRDYLTQLREMCDESDRIYPQVAVFGASATGRMSIGSPPLQQFPGPARGMIVADPGEELTSIDWSQIEPVTAANLARDHNVLAGYEAGTSDVYTAICEFAGIERKQAKQVLLADMYGQGIPLLSANLNTDAEAARTLKGQVHSVIPDMRRYFDQVKRATEEQECVPTISGRILPVGKAVNDEGRWRVQTHMGVNYHVQGSAYDVLAEAVIACDEAGLGDAIYLAMHDELVVATEAATDVRKIMETPPEALIRHSGRVPVLRTDRHDVGRAWAYV